MPQERFCPIYGQQPTDTTDAKIMEIWNENCVNTAGNMDTVF